MTISRDEDTPLSRANRGDLPTLLADEIRTWIVAGKLTPGNKLPTELELTLFALGSLFLIRRRLMAQGRVCPKAAEPPFRRARSNEISAQKPDSSLPSRS